MGEVKIEVKVSEDAYSRLSQLAGKLGVSVDSLASSALDVIASYSQDISVLGFKLAVPQDKIVFSVFEELIYYGVLGWREVVNKILEHLDAVGLFELEDMEFDPLGPLIEIEMVALEASTLKADSLRVAWSPQGVAMEVYYYLEGKAKPAPRGEVKYEWSYLPDENAVVISVTAGSIAELPTLRNVESEAAKLGI
ncbi:MAG: hypothetical protein P3X22_001910 [Thermoprotei archaeon]|nr:hypothetical protein [Thermoprotei archaeon]